MDTAKQIKELKKLAKRLEEQAIKQDRKIGDLYDQYHSLDEQQTVAFYNKEKLKKYVGWALNIALACVAVYIIIRVVTTELSMWF